MRYALLNESTRSVENVIELNDLDDWPVPDGCILIQSDAAGPGWILAEDELCAPPEPEHHQEEQEA